LPEPSASEAEVAVGKMKRYKCPGVKKTPAEVIQAGGETLPSEIHKLIKFIRKKRIASPVERENWSTYSQKRVTNLTAVIIEAYHCCQLHTKFYQTFFSLG
jgi:hypothetical protein